METRQRLERLLSQNPALPPPIAVTEPVVLYGAGRLGKMALALLSKVGIEVAYFIDRNAESLADSFFVPVLTPNEAAKKLPLGTPIFDCVFKDRVHLAADMLRPLGFTRFYTVNDLFFSIPDLHYGNGWQSGVLSDEDKRNICAVFDTLADEESRHAYLNNLRWRIAREPAEPAASMLMAEDDKYFNAITRQAWLKDSTFIDAGSFDLYFTLQALDAARNPFVPESVLVFEPDPELFVRCKEIAMGLPAAQQKKISLSALALAEEKGMQHMLCGNDLASRLLHAKTARSGVIACQTTTLDSIAEDYKNIKYLKLHVEGEELACLQGGTQLLAKHWPLVNINCAHNRDGLWKLMHFTMQHTSNYKYYFRAYANYGEGSTFYAVPS
jgi:FkbM family methyltransferase